MYPDGKFRPGTSPNVGKEAMMENTPQQKPKEKAKKQVPLRLSASLYNELAQWAEDDFRSLNGQIEYLLTQCVKNRKK